MRFIPVILILAWAVTGCTGSSAETAEDLIRKAQLAASQQKHDDARKLLEQAVKLYPTNALTYFAMATMLDFHREFEPALTNLDRALQVDTNHSGAYQLRGMVKFKLARIRPAIADFNEFIIRNPTQVAHHWQRGIALYYAGLYADGLKQFTAHQRVNPRDVENAVWHFLCNTRAKGLDQARKELIPIEGDPRVPMREIQELFAGTGSPEKVLAAAGAAGGNDDARRNYYFFAHLYIGLYHEAHGDAAKSREHIGKAAGEFSVRHYMGDVARVHLKLRDEAPPGVATPVPAPKKK